MAQGRKGEFGSNWWAKSWNNVLERFGYASRLQRGRTYARGGNVLRCSIKTGEVLGSVSGSRARPYKVSISIKPLTAVQWDKVIEVMGSQAIFTAKLLAGEMPEEIEKAFRTAGVSLFPENSSELKTDCSCPDYANPCKHIAAVYYILGQEFDKDPFMIFLLRGMGKNELLEALRRSRISRIVQTEADIDEIAEPKQAAETIDELIYAMDNYTHLSDDAKNMTFSYEPTRVPYTLIKRLGIPPFWNDPSSFEAAVLPYYTGMQEYVDSCLEEELTDS